MRTLQNEKILITGPAGQIAFPMATKLAQDNEVWGIARFGDPSTRDRVEAVGITTRVVDLANPDFSELPDDFTYVLHLAIFQQGGYDFDEALRVNAEGTGLLMSHCRKARGFFIMSTCSIYAWPEDPYHPVKETDPLGGEEPSYSPTYPLSKTAQEAVARFAARLLNLPTTIARMNVSYGPNGGLPAYQFDWMLAGQPVPIQPDRPSVCAPIHEDDITGLIPGMLAAARVPATIVNFGGDDAVDVETYCTYMAEIAGLKAEFERSADHFLAAKHVSIDNTRRRELVGDCQVKWREGLRGMIAARHPELKLKA